MGLFFTSKRERLYVDEIRFWHGRWRASEDALVSERVKNAAADALTTKLMLVVDDDEQIYNRDTDHERLMRAKLLIATHWGLDDFKWDPDE